MTYRIEDEMILEIGIDARCLACQIRVHPDLSLSHPSLSRQIRVDIDVYLTDMSGLDPDLTAREDDRHDEDRLRESVHH
jgi:hypothetical protein